MNNIVFASASQLAQMIRQKEVSAVEVLDAYLRQIDKHNDKLNAIARGYSLEYLKKVLKRNRGQ